LRERLVSGNFLLGSFEAFSPLFFTYGKELITGNAIPMFSVGKEEHLIEMRPQNFQRVA
jgi:hypothetical protein